MRGREGDERERGGREREGEKMREAGRQTERGGV